MNAQVTYIHHSGYMIELNDKILIFDYIKGQVDLDSSKDIYIFSSHSHGDHYTTDIFKYYDVAKKYILSSDINKSSYEKYKDKVISVKARQEIELDSMKIKTLLSTDAGVAFVVTYMGKNIFYAGDLNDWYWEMEDDENQRKMMHDAFAKEIGYLEGMDIDIAMFPVDPRQAGQYDLGGSQVLKLNPKHFFPMHFWGNYSITTKFKDKYKNEYKTTQIHKVVKDGEKFSIEI